MIRREHHGDWLIIDQIEHARIAAELARNWKIAPGTSLFLADEPPPLSVWVAVAAHDDGWRDWDRSPRIEPQTGVPREFREMRMVDSTAMWTKSVERAATIPLAAYAISKHFTYLAEHSLLGGHSDGDGRQAAERFLEEQAAAQSRLADDAHRRGDGGEFERWHAFAYRAVQFFDSLSLWLCCHERPVPQSYTSPAGETVALRLQGTPIEAKGTVPNSETGPVVIEPYPFAVESMCLTATARRIVARRYVSDADLQLALEQAAPQLIHWWFVRRS